jgi:hypothetical protein
VTPAFDGDALTRRHGSSRPVAVWHDLGFAGYLVSELGRVEGLAMADKAYGHCPQREYCSIVRDTLGRCLLFSAATAGLPADGAAHLHNFRVAQIGDLLTLSVDHAGPARGAASWTYRLLPLRWRNVDPPGVSDPALLLGVWPD